MLDLLPAAIDRALTSGKATPSESLRRQSTLAATASVVAVSTRGMREGDAQRVKALLLFGERQDLCRGVPLNEALLCFGRVFGQGTSAALFECSRPVTELATFLSHNWSTPRFAKYWTVIFFHHFDGAALVASLLVPAAGFATFRGWLPLPLTEQDGSAGFLCRLLFVPLFVGALVLRAELLGRCGLPGQPVFLDKMCISQSDAGLMKQGIDKLGAFIRVSKRMLVIYTDQYTRKLWTVYEVAAFLTLHSVDHLDIAPVVHSALFLKGMALMFLVNVLSVLMRTFIRSAMMNHFGVALACFCYLSATRRWHKERDEALDRLQNFTVETCSCAVEADRALIYSNIALLMQARCELEDDDEERALLAFEQLVRSSLPPVFASMFGRTCFAYKHYALFGIAYAGTTTADTISRDANGPLQTAAATIALAVLWSLTLWPLVLILCERVARWRPGSTGVRDFLWRLFLCMAVCIPGFCLYFSSKALESWAFSSTAGLATLVALTGIGPVGPWLLASGKCHHVGRKTGGSGSADTEGGGLDIEAQVKVKKHLSAKQATGSRALSEASESVRTTSTGGTVHEV